MTSPKFTRFTSSDLLAKVISRGPDGGIAKKSSAQMYRGQFETLTLDTSRTCAAHRLSEMLQGWAPTQA